MKFIRQFLAAWRMRKAFDPVLLARAKELAFAIDFNEGSGEYKRHQVYARLIKEFPSTKHRHLALAIEIALCG